MPKVTFIIDGDTTVVDFEHGEVPYSHHGKPESFLDIAKHFGVRVRPCPLPRENRIARAGSIHSMDHLALQKDRCAARYP